MVDRIADPWGERTPYGPGETWPTRVDAFLGDDLGESDVDAWVQSASVLHSDGDAIDIAVKDGRIVGVRGRAMDRINHGRLDPKDLYGWQANNSPDRLTRPLVRENGRLVPADWDTAMGRIVDRSKQLLEGPGGWGHFGFYTTGQLFLEEYYTLGVIGKAGLGTPHMDGNTRLCTATAASALKASFGTDGQPGSYRDLDTTDVILHCGHNIASQQTVLWTRILDRLAGPNPPTIIAIDPRDTFTAEKATIHLAPKAGTNMAVMNGLLHLVIQSGKIDHTFIFNHTTGFEELKKIVSTYTPEKVQALSGVPASQLIAAGEILSNAKTLVSTVL